MEPLHVSSAAGYHTLASHNFQEPSIDRSMSPLQGHQWFHLDLPHEGSSGQYNLEDIFDDDVNSNATILSNVAIGQAISNHSPKPKKDTSAAQPAIAQIEPLDQRTSISFNSIHMETTRMQTAHTNNVASMLTSISVNTTLYGSRNSTDWRKDLQRAAGAGSLNARLLSKLLMGGKDAIQRHCAKQRLKHHLKLEDVDDEMDEACSLCGNDGDKRARSAVVLPCAANKKRRAALVGVTGTDDSTTVKSSITAEDRHWYRCKKEEENQM